MIRVLVLGAVTFQTTCSFHESELTGSAKSEMQAVDGEKTAAFAEQVMEDVGKTMLGGLSYIGDRLGLFKTMASMESFSAKELAEAAGCNQRLVEEWLKAMVSHQYVLYDSSEKRFTFPPEHAAVLADEDSPFFGAGGIEYALPAVLATHNVMEAFRTGIPVTSDVFHPDIWEGSERWSTPMYRHQLVQKWIPLMPDVLEALQKGAMVADVGCGAGRALIAMANAFRNSKMHGFDVYEPVIVKARTNAREAGIEGGLEFFVGGTGDLPRGQYDLIINFWVLHHYSHPVKEMEAIRQALAPNGSYLVMEDRMSSEPDENIHSAARVAYASSTLTCLHDSMANNGAGVGVCSEQDIRRLAQQAGFGYIRVLTLDDPYTALYQLKK
jgi:SAM-dependent methyltransferase